MSASWLAIVCKLVDICQQVGWQLSATVGLNPCSGCSRQSPYVLSRKGAKNAKAPAADARNGPSMPCLANAQRTQRPHPIAGAVSRAGPKGKCDRFHYKIGWVISLGPARGTAPAADTRIHARSGRTHSCPQLDARIHARGWMHAFVFLLWGDWVSPPS